VNPSSQTIAAIRPYLSRSQLSAMQSGCKGEEGEYFQGRIILLASEILAAPVTYAQDGKGDDAIVYFHYFTGASDWYITELDMDGGIDQAFGFAILNGDTESAELGYISIRELVQHGAELDLFFTPCTLGEIKRECGVPA